DVPGLASRTLQTGIDKAAPLGRRYDRSISTAPFWTVKKPMSKQPDVPPSLNSWLEEEMYSQFVNGQTPLDDAWVRVFRDAHYGEAPNGGSEAHASSPAANATPV